MKKISYCLLLAGLIGFTGCKESTSKEVDTPVEEAQASKPLAVGYAMSIARFDEQRLSYAKSVGVEYMEASGMSTFVDGDLNFKMSDKEIRNTLEAAKTAADKAGVKIWSIHMPFGKNIDLSHPDEDMRQKVVAVHSQLLEYLQILQPEVILFHPSYYLGLNEREMRTQQMIKSATELNEKVQQIGAIMVIENMLGPELLKDEDQERPLMRTVEETVAIFDRLPQDIYAAVDMNHIKHPEQLILALGERMRSVHIADGTGLAENHFFPCSGEGLNDWTAILAAIDQAGYSGPFMYESSPEDAKEYLECYQKLYQEYQRTLQ